MDAKKLSGILLIIGGTLELMIAALHFIWPFNFIQFPDFNKLTASIKEFILLAFFSMGLCMTIFAFLSFYFSKRISMEVKSSLILCFSQVILWLFRLILEIILPVRVSLFAIKSPSILIIIAGIMVIIIYLTPIFLLRNTISNK